MRAELTLYSFWTRFFLASTDVARSEKERGEVLAALTPNREAADDIGQYFFNKTRELLTSSSYSLVGGKSRCSDVVRDVFKYVPIYWAASEIVSRTLSYMSQVKAYFGHVSRPVYL